MVHPSGTLTFLKFALLINEKWCRWSDSNRHFQRKPDFESGASTNSTTPAHTKWYRGRRAIYRFQKNNQAFNHA